MQGGLSTELSAVRKLHRILSGLEKDARNRVLAYLVGFANSGWPEGADVRIVHSASMPLAETGVKAPAEAVA